MSDPLSPRRGARASRCYVCGLMLACLVLSLGLLVVGCGDGSSDTDSSTVTTGPAQTAATTPTAGEMTGTELGEAIGATWAEAVQELDTLLDGQPEPSAVQSQVETLKEEYIQKFVAYGHQKEALDPAGQKEVNAATTAALSNAASADWYTTYMASYDAYSYASGNVDFCNLLASFNILTQYADFELLKAQAPEEAARLGIK
jgi:hypothetical protein